MPNLGEYLVRKDGEFQFRASVDGLEEGWELLGNGAKFKPVPHADWDDVAKKWKVNAERKAKAEKVDRAMAMSREELVDTLEFAHARLDSLEREIEALRNALK